MCMSICRMYAMRCSGCCADPCYAVLCCAILQVKETSLVQHTVEGLAARVGQQVAGVVCPWRWSMPWQRRQQQATEGQDE
jgi:hypothetical protein